MKTTTSVLTTLQDRLSQVETELNLECSNLHRLLDKKNPAVARQLRQLQGSIGHLHESLVEVKTHLAELNPKETQDSVSASAPGPSISAREAGQQRHDDKITLADIFRGLLMADEPGQRDHRDS